MGPHIAPGSGELLQSLPAQGIELRSRNHQPIVQIAVHFVRIEGSAAGLAQILGGRSGVVGLLMAVWGTLPSTVKVCPSRSDTVRRVGCAARASRRMDTGTSGFSRS